MRSVPLMRSGVAYITVGVASLRDSEKILSDDEKFRRGAEMPKMRFLWDSGATQTTILKKRLIDDLGYTEAYIQKNKIRITEEEKPTLADGTKADLYKLPATRMSIGGHELQIDYIYTSDTLTNLSLLLGMNVLQHFKFTFDFDSIDEGAEHGRMFYEFRRSRVKPFTKLGEPFAYQLNTSSVAGAAHER